MRLRFPQLVLACAAVATVTLAILPPAAASAQTSGDWTTWLNNGGRSGYDSTETQITTSTAPNLTSLWTDSNAGSVSTEPIVAGGVVYYGSWDGLEHAVSATTGAPIWSTNLGSTTDSSCAPPESGVASSATITSVTINGTATNVDFVAGGDASLYALNAATGAVIWSTSLGTPPDTFLWSSPLYYNGNVYEGISSFGDCPLVRGGMVEMNAATGAIENTLYTIPSGCVGASVWGSPAVDTTTGDIYFGTGNGVCPNSPHPLVQAMVQTDSSLNVLSSWPVPSSQQIPDGDFGDSPTLFQTYISGVLHKMVGIDDKNGWYYAFDRSNIAAGPLWEVKLGYGGGDPALGGRGVIASSAYNGKNVLAASGVGKVGTTLCGGVAWALRPSNGGKIWKDCLPGAVLAPVTAVPGVEFVGAGNTFEAINSTNGALLWSFPDTTAGSDFWSPASIDNGVVYVGNQDGNLYAFHT